MYMAVILLLSLVAFDESALQKPECQWFCPHGLGWTELTTEVEETQ